MKYITNEQFLELDQEVQKVFMLWWKPEIGDNIKTVDSKEMSNVFYYEKDENTISYYDWLLESDYEVKIESYNGNWQVVPLLTLHQLWDFIEDKTGYDLQLINIDGYCIATLYKQQGEIANRTKYVKNKLECLFDLAVEIAKEEVENAEKNKMV